MKLHLPLQIITIMAVSTPILTNAQLYTTATIGGVPSVSGATLETLNEPSPPFLTLSGGANLVTGSAGGSFAAPFFSGSTAAFFGESPAFGADGTQYVVVGSTAKATFSFPSSQNYFGLLCGSLDADNSLTFYDTANNVIGTVYGSTIPPVTYYGDQGVGGTFYINITSTIPFSKVEASNSGDSTEFDDVAYAMVVPEPTSSALIGAGLCTVAALGLRRRFD